MRNDIHIDPEAFDETLDPPAPNAARSNGQCAADYDLEILRLAPLSPVEYDRERRGAASALGIRRETLDNLVQERCQELSPVSTSSGLGLPEIDPWTDAVEGAQLIDEMTEAIRRHVVVSEQQALAVALWIIHAHALEQAEHSPRLHISSPAPRCGKTVLLDTISAMVPRALRTEGISPAAVFRIIELLQPTMLIDEVDTFLKDNDDIRGLLNAGLSTVGWDHSPRWRKSSANIVPGLGSGGACRYRDHPRDDRGSVYHHQPSPEAFCGANGAPQNRQGAFGLLGRKAARWVADKAGQLALADPDLPDELNDRAQDKWRPLLAIADLLSASVGQRAREAARLLENESDPEGDNMATMALGDVADVIVRLGTPRVSSSFLVNALVNLEDRPWAEWRRGKPLTQNSLARLLKPFNIKPKQIKFEDKGYKGYERDPILDARDRYLVKPQDPVEEEGEEEI